nr:PIN domain-containing protein [Paenibacillus alkalitolerans]
MTVSRRELRWLLDGLSLEQRKAHPSVPDALIIATAKTYNLALVSRDRDMHFVEKELNMIFIKV